MQPPVEIVTPASSSGHSVFPSLLLCKRSRTMVDVVSSEGVFRDRIIR